MSDSADTGFRLTQKGAYSQFLREPSWTNFFQNRDQGGSGPGLGYYTDPSPIQQESHVVLLGKDKLPMEVHLRLCTDSQAHAGHDQEKYSLQPRKEGKVCIRSYQVGRCRSSCTLQPIIQEKFPAINLHFR